MGKYDNFLSNIPSPNGAKNSKAPLNKDINKSNFLSNVPTPEELRKQKETNLQGIQGNKGLPLPFKPMTNVQQDIKENPEPSKVVTESPLFDKSLSFRDRILKSASLDKNIEVPLYVDAIYSPEDYNKRLPLTTRIQNKAMGIGRDIKDSVFSGMVGVTDYLARPIDRALESAGAYPESWTKPSAYERRVKNELLQQGETEEEALKISKQLDRDNQTNKYLRGKLNKAPAFNFKEDPVTSRAYGLGEGVAGLGTMIGATAITKNPFAGGFLAGALDAYGQGGNTEDILKSGASSSVFMGVGGGAGKLAKGGVQKLIQGTGLQNTILGQVLKSTAGGLGFGLGGTASQEPLTPLTGYDPTSKDYIDNMLLGVLFETIPVGIQGISNAKYNRGQVLEGMKTYETEMKQSYFEARNTKDPNVRMNKYDKIINRNQEIKRGLESNTFTGASKEVNQAKQTLDMVTDLLRKERGRFPSETQIRLPKNQQGVKVQETPLSLKPSSDSIGSQQMIQGQARTPQTETPLKAPSTKGTDVFGIDERTVSNVGKRNVKAYQQQNEGVKPIETVKTQNLNNLKSSDDTVNDGNETVDFEAKKRRRSTDYNELIQEVSKQKEFKFYRRGSSDETKMDASKPRGLYTSRVDSYDFKSPHFGEGNTSYFGVANPKKPLVVNPVKAKHSRFRGLEGELSSGVSALEKLLPRQEFKNMMSMSKQQVIEKAKNEFPKIDILRANDSYEALESYAGELARSKGYDAIVQIDPKDPEFDEFVPLTNDIIKYAKGRENISKLETKKTSQKTVSAKIEEPNISGTQTPKQEETKLRFSSPTYTSKTYPESTGEGKIDKAITPSEMVKKFADRFDDVYIRKGRTGSKKVLADFDTRTYVTRIRKANDIPSLSHEMAHYLDIKHNIISSMSEGTQSKLASEFTDTQSDRMNLKTKARESFAETVRSYLVGSIDKSNSAFDTFVSGKLNPKDLEFLEEMRNDITNFINLDTGARIGKTIREPKSRIAKVKESLKGTSFKEVTEKLYTGLIYERQPTIRAAEELGGKEASKKMEEFWARHRGYKSTARTNVNPTGDADKFQTNIAGKKVGKSLYHVLEPVLKQGKDVESKFMIYMISRRAMDYKKRQLEMPLPYEDYVKELKTLDREHPEFKGVFSDIQKYKNNLLQLLVDTGYKKSDFVETITKDNPNHIYLFRDVSNKGGASKKTLKTSDPIKGVKGGGEDIISPYESLIKMTYTYWELARRQEALRTLVKLEKDAVGKGKLISKADPKFQKFNLDEADMKQVTKKLMETMFETKKGNVVDYFDDFQSDMGNKKLMSEIEDLAISVYRMQMLEKEGQVILYDKGKPIVYDIPDKMLYNALVNPSYDPGFLIKVLAKVGSFRRLGIITKPTFALRIFAREIGEDAIYTANGITPIDFVKSFIQTVSEGPIWKAAEREGALSSGYFDKDGEFSRKYLEEMRTTNSKFKKFKNKMRHPIETYLELLTGFDSAPKLAEFTRSLENEGFIPKQSTAKILKMAFDKTFKNILNDDYLAMTSELLNVPAEKMREAVTETRNLTYDYEKTGQYTKKHMLNSIFPFFNSIVQGGDIYYRNHKRAFEDRKGYGKRMLTRGLLMVLGTLGEYALNRENEHYQETPWYVKDLFWLIPLGDPKSTPYFLPIPKPFATSVIFSTLPRRIAERLDDDVYVSRRSSDSLWQSITNSFFPDLTPSGIAPYQEVLMNKNWTGSSIETYGERFRNPEERYDEYTSETSKAIASITKDLPIAEYFRSPKMIDHLIKGYTGTLGVTGLDAIDVIAGTKSFSDLVGKTGVTGLLVKDSSKTSRSINEFYDDKGKLMSDLNSIKFNLEQGKDVDIKTLQKYVIGKEMAAEYNKASKVLSELRALKKLATKQNNKNIEIMVQNQMVKVAKTINQLADAIEEKIK